MGVRVFPFEFTVPQVARRSIVNVDADRSVPAEAVSDFPLAIGRPNVVLDPPARPCPNPRTVGLWIAIGGLRNVVGGVRENAGIVASRREDRRLRKISRGCVEGLTGRKLRGRRGG